MSEHEHERLSAYLDGELPPAEMSAVGAHVAACPECAARLAEFAAVDEAAAALAATAPSGYFEALPGRMRARVEPRRSGARRLPAWTWAAAAALLLAVVTPLTLSKRSSLQMEPTPARERPAAAPPPTTPAVEAPPAKLQKVVRPPAAPTPSRPAANAAPSSDERAKREQEFAAAPKDADREGQPAEPAAEARRDAPVGALRLPAPGALSRVEPQAPRSRDTAAAQEEAADKGARKPATAATEPKAADAIAEALAEAAPAGKTVQQNGAIGGAAGRTPAYTEKDAAADEEWRRLQAARPQSVEEWRRLREELRLFADAAPAGPHADAARVRTIEVGYTAWRSGGDAADEAVFRRDAAAYLERGEDAKNKARVRGLLR